ncbi:hypothetical protein H0X06_01090 [Candidatus Dependentiae bacterium]|nr:hypothetical protein [Candidatus Dependentiae bacterium]
MKYVLFFLLLFSTWIQLEGSEVGITITMKSIQNTTLSHTLIDTTDKPTPTFLKLLEKMNITHNGTLQSIRDETQKAWLRPVGKERWENEKAFPHHNNDLLPLFKELLLIEKIEPVKQYYSHVVLLGATITSVRNRLAYLIQLWESGIRFDTLIVLTGQRPLYPTIESLDLLLTDPLHLVQFKENWSFDGQVPSTETEMIKYIFNQTKTPKEWNVIPLIFVDTPLQKTETGEIRRPNTQDTIKEWLSLYNPHPHSILALSNQPVIGYQDAVLRRFFPLNFKIETIGDIDSKNRGISTILDSLARWIYNEVLLIEETALKK